MDINWLYIDTWAKQEIDRARSKNDGDLNEIATAKLRGRLSVLKELIALPEDKRFRETQSRIDAPD